VARGLRTGLGYTGVLAVAIVLNFALPRLAPGDAIDYLLPPEVAGEISPAQRDRVLSQFGLGDSLSVQFGRYLGNLASGDLGLSVQYARPVGDVLLERIGWTALLVWQRRRSPQRHHAHEHDPRRAAAAVLARRC